MSDDSQHLSAVEAILAERDAVHGWLSRLDAAGNAAPDAVRDRVRADYERRLAAVTDRLREHADTIAARLTADRAEHDDLVARARIARDALAEAELRHAVGEFDSDRFEQERSRHMGDLETFELSIGAVAERIAALEDVEAVMERQPVESAAVPAAPESTSAGEPAAVGLGQPNTPIDSSPLDQVAAAIEADEEGFLAIFEPVEEAAAPEESGAESDPAGAAFGPLSFTPRDAAPPAPTPPTPTPPAAPPARAVPPGAPPLGMPEADQTPRFVRPSPLRGSELAEMEQNRRHEAEPPPAREAIELDPEPILPEPEAGDLAPRTLRCGECGAMNRPLEWYCEKCGAELAPTG